MTDKKENIQRILGNHGKITQNGDIIEFKNSKIENLNNILIQNLENSIKTSSLSQIPESICSF